MTDIDRRLTSVPVEIRAGSDKRTIGGYAAKFNSLSQNLGGFVERIDSRAFNASRGNGWPNVLARYNHEDNLLLGTTRAGTLRLSTDEIGLTYEVDVPKARSDVYELVQRGDVAQSSFAFTVHPEGDDWGKSDQGFPMRTLLSVRLYDVAPVNTPAYENTTAGALESLARKFEADLAEVRALAQSGDLMKFFQRTDKQEAKPVVSAQAVLAKAMSLK